MAPVYQGDPLSLFCFPGALEVGSIEEPIQALLILSGNENCTDWMYGPFFTSYAN